MSSNQPPPYSEAAPKPGYTPASYYQPPHAQHNPPQPSLYPPMPMSMPPQQSTVIIQTTSSHRPIVPIGFGSTRIICPSCRAEVLTTVKRQPSTRTHLCALILCVFICWPCVCLPYCMDSCQNANHYCPNCNAYIGTYQN